MERQPSTELIQALNDTLRIKHTGGRTMITAGIRALPPDTVAQILQAVTNFDSFNADNDPHGEHDFGRIEVAGETVFFKIDYYNSDMTAGSEDPSDPTQTTRVLLIMRADEY